MPRTPLGETRAKIHDYVCERILLGSPPSIREVQQRFGFKSTATVREHLNALVNSGALEQESGKDRGYRVPGAFVPAVVPILGQVRAGSLAEAIELADGYVAVQAEVAETTFALRVIGESMSGIDIHDGDIVLVDRASRINPGDVVVARVGDEATIKTFRRDKNRIILHAENPDFQDIVPDRSGPDFEILGRVYEVRRQL
jgi:repressor LexA